MDDTLLALSEAAGIATRWRDVRGTEHQVSPETQRALLKALGLDAETEADIADAHQRLSAPPSRPPPLIATVQGGEPLPLPGARPGHRFKLAWEEGGTLEGRLDDAGRLPTLDRVGYHRLSLDTVAMAIAVAPSRCPSLVEIGALPHLDAKPWTLAVQIPSLRRAGDGGAGDFTALGDLAEAAARHGAAGLAISPTHAQFAARSGKFLPYSPSSRLFLNPLLADPDAVLPGAAPAVVPTDAVLIDWPAVAAGRQARLRALFETASDDPRFLAFRAEGGRALEEHARFEALHTHLLASDASLWHWRDWPMALRSPQAPGVQAFAREHAGEVAFHAFCQWIADASLADAAARAGAAGMPLGLIADLAVGTDGAGSHAWQRQDSILDAASVGAPPDIFSPLGQDWGLATFSPLSLAAHGFAAFIEMLRANLRHAGGLRIDHAMGLRRLWLVPRGAGPADGAYLRYPLREMLHLLALEAHRHAAIVMGEDLGTLPEGFAQDITDAGMLGMRVLWFERGEAGGFRDPAHWTREAAAMTTTHDLPTVVGWWRGRDIDWREDLALLPDADAERRAREAERESLWQCLSATGSASGPRPAEDNPIPFLDAAIAQVGRSACELAILPLEDAMAEVEQPNLPGTVEGHPNWERRMPGEAATMLDAPDVAARLASFTAARRA
ncbi:4-alpha-glucanotransferase [Plastoroseomonas arctica]|uniref:4-alpha-glucanotransferase n=1 Tax=Plastoroseomonas arctica TaxID=1509237 RepID=A0AAF1KNI4_9PROT|nr:4-alpha-glucanotransferase [Plastoroseomonas arctica]MBR0654628.1 4-alpha-glucanotransferase [Plastoroseomonas arctica]